MRKLYLFLIFSTMTTAYYYNCIKINFIGVVNWIVKNSLNGYNVIVIPFVEAKASVI